LREDFDDVKQQKSFGRFRERGTYRISIHGDRNQTGTIFLRNVLNYTASENKSANIILKMEEESTSQMPVNSYPTTRRNNPEGSHLHIM
jgi:hypothetical protein